MVIFHIKTKKIKGKLHSIYPKQDEAFFQTTVGTDAKDTWNTLRPSSICIIPLVQQASQSKVQTLVLCKTLARHLSPHYPQTPKKRSLESMEFNVFSLRLNLSRCHCGSRISIQPTNTNIMFCSGNITHNGWCYL